MTTALSAGLNPPRAAIMRQTWSDIVWCHWPVPAAQVAALLPPGLEPELFDRSAWVGLIPFAMADLRLPGPLAPLSRLAGVDSFGEVNVRTYVTGPDGRSGVWFCTLDADRLLATAAARLAFGLPYRWARTNLHRDTTSVTWRSRRRGDKGRAEVSVIPHTGPGRPAATGLEQFLVERYALYSWWNRHLMRGTLSHEPWAVRPAQLAHLCSETVTAAGFTVSGSPHLLVGDPVHVTVHPLSRVIPRSKPAGARHRTGFDANSGTPRV
jgi:uncharacterized protein YqjF (DUF2071 family)